MQGHIILNLQYQPPAPAPPPLPSPPQPPDYHPLPISLYRSFSLGPVPLSSGNGLNSWFEAYGTVHGFISPVAQVYRECTRIKGRPRQHMSKLHLPVGAPSHSPGQRSQHSVSQQHQQQVSQRSSVLLTTLSTADVTCQLSHS